MSFQLSKSQPIALAEFQNKACPSFTLKEIDSNQTTKEHDYVALVGQAVDTINQSNLEKVVIAQTQHIKGKVDVWTTYKRLCARDDAYAYLLYLNGVCWIGASPELLCKVHGTKIETMSLAGTRVQDSSQNWGQKEIDEQRIVTDYIMDTLRNLGVEYIEAGQSFSKKAGNIEHICTPIYGRIPAEHDVINIASALHPTPALAGYPKQEAINFIANNEDLKRKLFGGFIGLRVDGSFESFVNIRCAEVGSNGCTLYAGAGINKNSNPALEWLETESKIKSVKDQLRFL